MHKKVLVTGACGFTGSHLIKRLARDGYSVRALVHDPERQCDFAALGVELAQGDILDPDSLDRATQGIDVVYHLAAIFRSENVPLQVMWDTNVCGTQNVIEASIRNNLQRVVHCSTVGVHGDVRDKVADEQTEFRPGDDYQVSKTEGERIARKYMEKGDIPIVIFRPGGIYGPGDLRFLKLFKSIKKHFFVMIGSGDVRYQLIYIDDLVDGIIRCGTLDQAVGNTYILTGEKPITLNELVYRIALTVHSSLPHVHVPVTPVYYAGLLCELVCKPLGIQPPLYRRRVDFFRKNRAFRIDKAMRELNFHPQVELPVGLQRTVDWYQENGLL